jgi:thiol:disulfide interchange protein DsbA
MKRRDFSIATLGTVAAAGQLGWSPSAMAQGPAKFVAGKDYLKLDRTVPSETEAGKIQLIEFFWYSCSHCNAFEPAFAQWIKSAPKDVVIQRIPVAFRDDFAPQQRLYFTLEAMGLLEKLHVKVFQAIHVERLTLNTDASILAWIEKQGVDKTKFADIAKSFGVASKLKRAVQLQNDFKIEGVPSLGIAGKYYIDGTLAGSMPRALQVADSLLAQVRQGRA